MKEIKRVIRYDGSLFIKHPYNQSSRLVSCDKPMIVIGIDPGSNAGGVSIWEVDVAYYERDRQTADTRIPVKTFRLVKTFNYNSGRMQIKKRVRPESISNVFHFDDIDLTANRLAGKLKEYEYGIACIEMPEFFQNSSVGMACAKSGDLIKLTYFVGYLARMLEEVGIYSDFVLPRGWKGNLSKEATAFRVQRKLEAIKTPLSIIERVSSHAWDAVGIGLHYIESNITNQSNLWAM